MRRSNDGFILTVILLVGVVALMAFLFSSAALTISSRNSSAQELSATQALLAADSGLNTLRARATTVPYSSSSGSFESWIESNFGTLDLGAGVAATLDVVAETANQVTVESTGRAGTSRRVILQAFEIIIGPPFPASVTVPGALTSVGVIKSSSNNVLVEGVDNTVADWTYTNQQLCNALPGEYVTMSGLTYEVVGEPDCAGTMDLRQVGHTTPISPAPAGSTLVTLQPIALAEPLTISGSPPRSTVEVTPAARGLFGLGSSVSIAATGMGKVTAVGETTLTIEWTSTPSVVTEGAPLTRDIVSGVTSAESCDLNKPSNFPDGCVGKVDLSNLFYKTFGVASPQLLKDSLDAAHMFTGDQLRTSGVTLSGISWLSSPENNLRDFKGSGILIVENDPNQSITLNVSKTDFKGMIYIIGDADLQGNTGEIGAVVVDGTANFTNVQGGHTIRYDPLELARALAGIQFPNPNPGGLGAAIADTWRIR